MQASSCGPRIVELIPVSACPYFVGLGHLLDFDLEALGDVLDGNPGFDGH